MQADILTIGDEILIGQIVDTNSAWIATELNNRNITVRQITSVSDSQQHIESALFEAGNQADLVIITGGLGPTKDDITKQALCHYFNTKLVRNADVLQDISNFIERRYGNLNELNKQQADVPQRATVLRNEIGTAPGLWFEMKNTIYISLPGVPFEMKELMRKEVFPRIENGKTSAGKLIIHKTISTTGIPESTLAEMLEGWENSLSPVLNVAYLPSPGNNRIRLTATGKDKAELKLSIERAVEGLKKIVGSSIVSLDNKPIAEIIGRLLINNNQTVATAESCTGGNIAHLITSISGSSAYFRGGIVAYSNKIKEKQLNVEPEVIEINGAVSQEVVEQMAVNVRKIMQTTYGIAISGIAGPMGERPGKPVGTTWIALATKDNVITKKEVFGDNRERNILRASIAALNLLRVNISE